MCPRESLKQTFTACYSEEPQTGNILKRSSVGDAADSGAPPSHEKDPVMHMHHADKLQKHKASRKKSKHYGVLYMKLLK